MEWLLQIVATPPAGGTNPGNGTGAGFNISEFVVAVATAINALATVVLVKVTITYVTLTNSQLVASRQQLRHQVTPNLSGEIQRPDAGRRVLIIRNHGPGHAFAVRCTLTAG